MRDKIGRDVSSHRYYFNVISFLPSFLSEGFLELPLGFRTHLPSMYLVMSILELSISLANVFRVNVSDRYFRIWFNIVVIDISIFDDWIIDIMIFDIWS